MSFDIIKAENGWILRRTYVNTASTENYVFEKLRDLADWIVVNVP